DGAMRDRRQGRRESPQSNGSGPEPWIETYQTQSSHRVPPATITAREVRFHHDDDSVSDEVGGPIPARRPWIIGHPDTADTADTHSRSPSSSPSRAQRSPPTALRTCPRTTTAPPA